MAHWLEASGACQVLPQHVLIAIANALGTHVFQRLSRSVPVQSPLINLLVLSRLVQENLISSRALTSGTLSNYNHRLHGHILHEPPVLDERLAHYLNSHLLHDLLGHMFRTQAQQSLRTLGAQILDPSL